jgi:FMN reductase (NADPH)/FMN reductase [NAD(P)H]
MNETIRLIANRRSVRAFCERPVARETVDQLVASTLRAPTAGGMMLYSLIEITDQAIKEQLAESCDHQPFIGKAPLVFIFLADYQRWYDYMVACGVPALCARQGAVMRRPGEGDLLLACCDALIAAQTMVVAAESLGLGSCYIGDIMERYEFHRELLHLPQYTFPIGMLCLGYPAETAAQRKLTPRYDREFLCFQNQYQRQDTAALERMMAAMPPLRQVTDEAANEGQRMYLRKFGAAFSYEMTRSAAAAIRAWCASNEA